MFELAKEKSDLLKQFSLDQTFQMLRLQDIENKVSSLQHHTDTISLCILLWRSTILTFQDADHLPPDN